MKRSTTDGACITYSTKCIPRSLWNCALWSLLSPVACCLGTAAHASTKGMPSCFNYPEWHWNKGDSSIKTSIYREIPILDHGFALTFPYSFAAKVHVEQESQLKHTGWLHAGAHRRKSSFIIASVLHHCFSQMSYDKIYYPCEPVKNMVRILWLVALPCFTVSKTLAESGSNSKLTHPWNRRSNRQAFCWKRPKHPWRASHEAVR